MSHTLVAGTPGNVIDWALHNGFKREPGAYANLAWLRKGNVRIVFDDTDICIYVFVANDVLDWDVRLSNAPLVAVTATITAALDTVRASLLPED